MWSWEINNLILQKEPETQDHMGQEKQKQNFISISQLSERTDTIASRYGSSGFPQGMQQHPLVK